VGDTELGLRRRDSIYASSQAHGISRIVPYSVSLSHESSAEMATFLMKIYQRYQTAPLSQETKLQQSLYGYHSNARRSHTSYTASISSIFSAPTPRIIYAKSYRRCSASLTALSILLYAHVSGGLKKGRRS